MKNMQKNHSVQLDIAVQKLQILVWQTWLVDLNKIKMFEDYTFAMSLGI